MTTATAKAPQSLPGFQKSGARFRVHPHPSQTPLPQKVINILEHLSQGWALAEICRHEQLSIAKCQAVINKLTAQGVLEPLPSARSRPQAMPAVSEQRWVETLKGLPVFGSKNFDSLEEAFFASEVEAQDEEDLPPPRLRDRLRGLLASLRRRQP